MRWFLVLLLLPLDAAAWGADLRPANYVPSLCSLSGGGPRFSVSRTQRIVAEAEVIVRATALREIPAPAAEERRGAKHVAFEVREVLRGSGVPDTLRFTGVIRDEDAVPPELVEEVPHLSYIRRYAGDCQAFTYRAGGEYLLLLQLSAERGSFDPYWTLLAPTNNQIGGDEDRWLRWVRAEIARNPSRRS